MATMRRTRQSFGSQLREALVECERRGIVTEWATATLAGGRLGYYLEGPQVYFPFYTPGELADWLNDFHGFDIRIGKS